MPLGYFLTFFHKDLGDFTLYVDNQGVEHSIYINPDALKDVLLSKDGDTVFLLEQGRVSVIAKVGDSIIPFYSSSEGTGGKNQGSFYPFFGNIEGWVVKGNINKDTGEMSYSPEIDAVTKLINDNFKITGDVALTYIYSEGNVKFGMQDRKVLDANKLPFSVKNPNVGKKNATVQDFKKLS